MATGRKFCILYAVSRIKFYLEISTGFVWGKKEPGKKVLKKFINGQKVFSQRGNKWHDADRGGNKISFYRSNFFYFPFILFFLKDNI